MNVRGGEFFARRVRWPWVPRQKCVSGRVGNRADQASPGGISQGFCLFRVLGQFCGSAEPESDILPEHPRRVGTVLRTSAFRRGSSPLGDERPPVGFTVVGAGGRRRHRQEQLHAPHPGVGGRVRARGRERRGGVHGAGAPVLRRRLPRPLAPRRGRARAASGGTAPSARSRRHRDLGRRGARRDRRGRAGRRLGLPDAVLHQGRSAPRRAARPRQAAAAARERRARRPGQRRSRASPPGARRARRCTRSRDAPRSTGVPSSCAARAAPART